MNIIPQLAPPPPDIQSREKLPRSMDVESSDEDFAAEVAGILSKTKARPANSSANAPRPTVVRMPSESWLIRASAEIESLPVNARPAAFQKIMEHYKMMRIEERAATNQSGKAL